MAHFVARVTQSAFSLVNVDGLALDHRPGVRLIRLENLDCGDPARAVIPEPRVAEKKAAQDHAVGRCA